MGIERIKVRATIEVGSITVVTPFIQSFNVRKQRGQVSTFDASLKVAADEVYGPITGGPVTISAGEESREILIFTGMCRSAKISPCFDDPKYVILSISGADNLILLKGKTFTRRCRSSRSTWVAITDVVREGLKSGKFTRTNEPTIQLNGGVQFKDDTMTAHSSTEATDVEGFTKPIAAPSGGGLDTVQLHVEINETIPVGGE